MFKCNICNREFKSQRSLNSHKNHHNPIYKEKSLQGAKHLNGEKARQSRKVIYEQKKLESWKKRNSNCLSCDKPLVYPQEKTCSDSCYKEWSTWWDSNPHVPKESD